MWRQLSSPCQLLIVAAIVVEFQGYQMFNYLDKFGAITKFHNSAFPLKTSSATFHN